MGRESLKEMMSHAQWNAQIGLVRSCALSLVLEKGEITVAIVFLLKMFHII